MTECVFVCNQSKEERLKDIEERILELKKEREELRNQMVGKRESVPPVYMVYDSHIHSERYAPVLFTNPSLAIEYIGRMKEKNPNLKWKEVGICFELYDEKVKE